MGPVNDQQLQLMGLFCEQLKGIMETLVEMTRAGIKPADIKVLLRIPDDRIIHTKGPDRHTIMVGAND